MLAFFDLATLSSFSVYFAYLCLIEALQSTLLTVGTLLMRFENVRVDVLQPSEYAFVQVDLELLRRDNHDQADEGEDQERSSGDVDV